MSRGRGQATRDRALLFYPHNHSRARIGRGCSVNVGNYADRSGRALLMVRKCFHSQRNLFMPKGRSGLHESQVACGKHAYEI